MRPSTRTFTLLTVLAHVSSSTSQFADNLLGLNLEDFYENVKNVEQTFGPSLAQKMVSFADDVQAEGFTYQRALEFIESLTAAEQENAALGVIRMVEEVATLAKQPGTKNAIKMGLQLAPIVLRQVIASPLVKKEEKPTEKRAEKIVPIILNTTKMSGDGDLKDEYDDMSTETLRRKLEQLSETMAVPGEFLDMANQILEIAEAYEDRESGDKKLALDDKSTLRLSGIQDELQAKQKSKEAEEELKNKPSTGETETANDEL